MSINSEFLKIGKQPDYYLKTIRREKFKGEKR